MTSRPRAIVAGTELPRAIGVIRSLGRAGVEVLAFDHRPRMPGVASRYVSRAVVEDHNALRPEGAPRDWHFSDERALASLEALGREGGGVLIATNDDYLRLFSQHHAHLSQWFSVANPPWEILGPLMEKIPSYAVAREAGLDVPETLRPKDEAELRELVAGLDLARQHYLLRLDVWASGPADVATGAFTLPGGETREGLISRALEIFGRTGSMPILQEVVRGDVDSSIGVAMVVAPDGRLLVAYEIRRLGLYAYSRGGGFDHPYALGANVYAESAHDPEARRLAEQVIAHSGYSGAVTVEFRRDERTGRLRFIKTDCRAANAVSLGAALGMDAPLALYRAFSGEDTSDLAPQPYRDGVGWLWVDRYLRTIRENTAGATRPVLTLLRRAHRLRAFGFESLEDRAPMRRTWQKEWARMRKR